MGYLIFSREIFNKLFVRTLATSFKLGNLLIIKHPIESTGNNRIPHIINYLKSFCLIL